jgi:hypothetical protein
MAVEWRPLLRLWARARAGLGVISLARHGRWYADNAAFGRGHQRALVLVVADATWYWSGRCLKAGRALVEGERALAQEQPEARRHIDGVRPARQRHVPERIIAPPRKLDGEHVNVVSERVSEHLDGIVAHLLFLAKAEEGSCVK